MTPAGPTRGAATEFATLAAALGADADGVRCPDCDVHYLREVRPGAWDCPRCGRVENPRSTVERDCPYCGRPGLALCWEEGLVECGSCGVVDKEDLWAILRE